MNKTIWYIIGAIIVIGGIWWYVASRSNTNLYAPESTTTTTNTTSTNGTKPQNLTELLANATPQTCTFQNNTAENSVQATLETANGMLRGDFTTNVAGKITYTHVIIKSSTSYTWIDGQTTGVKSATANTSSTLAANINLNTLDGFTCTNAATTNVDLTKFNLPAGITFK